MDGKTLERILEIVDEYKKYACLEYGWNLNLWDRDDLVSGYPFINLKIFWRKEENRKVIDKVNEVFFDDLDVKYEDLAIFINNYNAVECHNAACSLLDNSYIAEWLLKNGIGNVYCHYDEDYEILRSAGLNMRHCGRFANVGKLKKIRRGSKEIVIFIPNKVREITSRKFYEWYRNQDRFEIAYDESEDFWYLREKAAETIRQYRRNPLLFIKDYPKLEELLADQGFKEGYR